MDIFHYWLGVVAVDDDINSISTNEKVVSTTAIRESCGGGPVISVAFAIMTPTTTTTTIGTTTTQKKMVAAGCMDGSVSVYVYDWLTGQGLTIQGSGQIPTKHEKYVKKVAWKKKNGAADDDGLLLLASASADGTVQIHKVTVKENLVEEAHEDDDNNNSNHHQQQLQISVTHQETFHFNGAVEALCFVRDRYLVCYARETPYLMVFDTVDNYSIRKINLNSGGRPAAAGTTLEDQHVSFAVMEIIPSPPHAHNQEHKYLALATDTSKHCDRI